MMVKRGRGVSDWMRDGILVFLRCGVGSWKWWWWVCAWVSDNGRRRRVWAKWGTEFSLLIFNYKFCQNSKSGLGIFFIINTANVTTLPLAQHLKNNAWLAQLKWNKDKSRWLIISKGVVLRLASPQKWLWLTVVIKWASVDSKAINGQLILMATVKPEAHYISPSCQ